MQSSVEHLSYRLPNGHILNYTIDHLEGVTTAHMDYLVNAYFQHTGNVPETIFIRTDLFANYLNSMSNVMRYDSSSFPTDLVTNITMWLSVGQVTVTTIPDAYILLLIGSQEDYDDNDINWLFEETILKDCERE